MKHAKDPAPFPFERSPMRIVPLSSAAEGTNEVADVSVIEAHDHVWSCPCTHGCVLTTINVIKERRRANCRVVVAQTGSARVILVQCQRPDSNVLRGRGIAVERLIPIGDVFITVDVSAEGAAASSRVAVADCVVIERDYADPNVTRAGCILEERIGTIGHVITGSVTVERVIASRRIAHASLVIE